MKTQHDNIESSLFLLTEEEISDPYGAIAAYCTANPLEQSKDQLWYWLVAAGSDNTIWEYEQPGYLLRFVRQMEKLIELAALIKQEALVHPMPEMGHQENMWELNIPSYRLTSSESIAPHRAILAFFDFFSLNDCRVLIKDQLEAALLSKGNSMGNADFFLFHASLVKLLKAIHLIAKREVPLSAKL